MGRATQWRKAAAEMHSLSSLRNTTSLKMRNKTLLKMRNTTLLKMPLLHAQTEQ